MIDVVRAAPSALLAILAFSNLVSCDSGAPETTTSHCSIAEALCLYPACVADALQEITLEQAREMGFSIDTPLSFFGDRLRVSDFHFGNAGSCSSAPSTDGQIRYRVRFKRLLLQTQKPLAAGFACEDYLVYEGITELEADGGLISGVFESTWHPTSEGIETSVDVDPAAFEGSLGIRVDAGRAHEAKLNVTLGVRDADARGAMRTIVHYLNGDEPAYDIGEGLLWPASQAGEYCHWFDTDPSDSPLLSIDEYNARQ
jgi:hypothetical protein